MDKVVIIGAGLGGLTAAAKLSKEFEVTVLEKSAYIGGRASSRIINGSMYDTGAVLLGGRLKEIINELGGQVETKNIKYQIIYNNKPITFPLGLHLFNELKRHGVRRRDSLKFVIKSLIHAKTNFFSHHKTIKNLVHELTKELHLRNALKSVVLFSGLEPSEAHSNYFNYFFWGHKYHYDKPFYPKDGAVGIAEALKRIIESNGGKIILNSEVKRILTKNDRVIGVETPNKKYFAPLIVSNLTPQTTQKLSGQKILTEEQMKKHLSTEAEISTATLFFKLKNNTQFLPKGVLFIAQIPQDTETEIEKTKKGVISNDCLYLLEVPNNIYENFNKGFTTGSIIILVNKNITKKEIDKKISVVVDHINSLYPGFANQITFKKTICPSDSLKEIGINTIIGVKETPSAQKLDVKTNIRGLYLAGDSIQPEVACTVQAAESGLKAANQIAKDIKASIL